MSAFDKVRLVVYRMHEKGIEIFLVNTHLTEHEELWRFPMSKNDLDLPGKPTDWIELDPVKMEDGTNTEGIAFEGDWHDIPSIRSILKHDVHMVTSKMKEVGSELEKGSFFTLKEAFKRVLPHEYTMLKELKDVLLEKNQTKSI